METKQLIKKDLTRYGEKHLAKALIKHSNFRNIFYYRLSTKRVLKKICSLILPPVKSIEIWGNIGGGLKLFHKMGCTILVNQIGENCSIYQGVTLGKGNKKDSNGNNLPVLGNNVSVYTNAVVLGGIKIGDNVEIGAGSVVLEDIPANAVVVGVPAKIIKIKDIT